MLGSQLLESASARLSTGYMDLVRDKAFVYEPTQLAALVSLSKMVVAIEAGESSEGRYLSRHLGLSPVRRNNDALGAYIFGPVGCGKTLIMDQFFSTTSVKQKRRTHFHTFMRDIHLRIHRMRAEPGGIQAKQAIASAIDDIAATTQLLCFDEFAIDDVADAMMLRHLFTALLSRGVAIVTTSNFSPQELYKDGIGRENFLPLIETIVTEWTCIEISGIRDFRSIATIDPQMWIIGDETSARSKLDRVLDLLAGGRTASNRRLLVDGHILDIPIQADSVARFSFDELCVRRLSAVDYLALASCYGTIIIDRIPQMGYDRRNHVKRLITLIDIMYEAGTHIFASADSALDNIYTESFGTEARLFRRTISRLNEMLSRGYRNTRRAHPIDQFALNIRLVDR